MNMHEPTGGINVTDLEMQGFVESESHRIDGPKEHEHPLCGGGRDETVYLVDGQHLGQGVDVLQFQHPEDFPVSFAGDGEEEFDTRECNAERSVSKSSLVFEMEEELANVGLGDLVGAALCEVGQLANGAEVSVLRAFGLASQLQVFGHALAQ